jgi:type II secretory pathway pseudopilin PulG
MKRVASLMSFARAGRSRETAFTQLELMAVIAALALLAGVVLPALAQSKPRAQQSICFNNLRMIGQAMLLFNAENGQMDPWRTPGAGYNTPSGLGNNAWFQFAWLSNGLTNPKVLACPSDTTRPAKDYSFSPDGGLLNANYRNQAISYFTGLDSSVLLPGSVLAGDRNIQFQGFGSCSTGINPAATINVSPQASTLWLKGLHGPSGNILLHDGRVEETTSQTVSRNFQGSDDNGSVHLLIPSFVL